ncbi:MAG TPA: FHA domain-containing protein [Blastocatellia bacterium]|nr:FHA domain-containing protein [Blastocatellia bacterium]
MKLELHPPSRSKREKGPIFQPPSAVHHDSSRSNTIEGPLPAPPSFTTSTSIPKPALPVRDRRKAEGKDEGPTAPRLTDERSAPDFSAEPPAPSRSQNRHGKQSPQTIALSSASNTGNLEQPSRPNGSEVKVQARLVVERGGRIGREFPITGIETNIGRWDADSGIFPDVDLDEHDPEAKISRRHARIVSHNGQYFIEDLGSTNGTFVNRGRRLLPGKRHALQNGDEIIVGKTFLKFQLTR